ncbi:MAG: hypothetical protein GEU86_15575 [Actinophytocola sp.]|nr:hypothetical protein [Actinophytocola sp.]
MNKLRRSYEARVLLVPLGHTATQLTEQMAGLGLDGITMLATAGNTVDVRPLASADMVVLLAADLTEVSESVCLAVSRAAEANGVLTAALIVGSDHEDAAQGGPAMAALRKAVDMLVIVRHVRLATSFLDVLRGGARDDPDSLAQAEPLSLPVRS